MPAIPMLNVAPGTVAPTQPKGPPQAVSSARNMGERGWFEETEGTRQVIAPRRAGFAVTSTVSEGKPISPAIPSESGRPAKDDGLPRWRKRRGRGR